MLISELDLCKREWLELVFADRNKTYGAYELRTRYNTIMFRAVAATVFVISALAVTANIISHRKPAVDLERRIDVVIQPTIKTMPKDKPKPPVELPKEAPAAATKPAPPVNMQRYVPYKPVPDQFAEDVQPIKENVAVGSKDVTTPNGTNADNVDVNIPENGPGIGGNGVTEDKETIFLTVEDMPKPKGGMEAWAKFLQKNLRFPGMAQQEGVSGKVFVSFIIERDGHLTDIKLVRGAGYGFDEEAMRVLKLAPAWSPGKQNGNPVRVQFTMPINFQINNDN